MPVPQYNSRTGVLFCVLLRYRMGAFVETLLYLKTNLGGMPDYTAIDDLKPKLIKNNI